MIFLQSVNMVYRQHYLFYLALLACLFSSCTHRHTEPPIVLVDTTEAVSISVNELIRTQMEQFASDSLLILNGDTLRTAPWIYTVFKNHDFEPLWSNEQQLNSRGRVLLSVIDTAFSFGLLPSDYHANLLHEKINNVFDRATGKYNATILYEINILFTDAFYRMAVHIKKGKLDSETMLPAWKGNPGDTIYIRSLESGLDTSRLASVLNDLQPKDSLFTFLKFYYDSLFCYNTVPFWEPLNYHIDDSLHHDVIKCDSCHTDSLIHRMRQVMVNLERLRWEKITDDTCVVKVNIPSFTMKLIHNDSVVIKSRVIAGKPDTPSPWKLNSRITHFFIYPYWIVPFSIATKEILPSLIKDTGYLARHNMEVLDTKGNVTDASKIKWKKYNEKYFPYKLRQRDGDDNTLGILKFIFANKYGIYLHDTSAPKLFKRNKRALSHGCIRLEKARELASYFVYNGMTVDFDSLQLSEKIKNKERTKVMLKHAVPVRIRYYTCLADSTGIFFYDDIYKLDKIMEDNFFLFEDKENTKVIL